MQPRRQKLSATIPVALAQRLRDEQRHRSEIAGCVVTDSAIIESLLERALNDARKEEHE